MASVRAQDGTVGFWWLDPVEELPLTSPRGAHTPRGHLAHGPPAYTPPSCVQALLDPCAMLGMFGPVSALAWLHNPPTAAAAAAGGRRRSSSGSWAAAQQLGGEEDACASLVYLACAVPGTVYVYALHLHGQGGHAWGLQVRTRAGGGKRV